MTHKLESFIQTLKTDGVEAGREAADQIRREAEREAEQTVRDAEAKAKEIVKKAEEERERIVARTQTDLELAARDTVARLREALGRAVNKVLAEATEQKLGDSDYLAELIREVVGQYAKADALGEGTFTLNVSEAMRQRLTHWVIATFHKPPKELSLDLHGSLTGAGFEYRVEGGTVEITPESVVQVLSDIVAPEIRKLIASAVDAH
ncbi:MAG: hypothetical protein GXX96_33230 [Planctomycetaceae bacterium]|nr:hypothetical protein [Planctomycetaceae bacterium]